MKPLHAPDPSQEDAPESSRAVASARQLQVTRAEGGRRRVGRIRWFLLWLLCFNAVFHGMHGLGARRERRRGHSAWVGR